MKKTLMIGIGGAGIHLLNGFSSRQKAAHLLLINTANNKPKQSYYDFIPIDGSFNTLEQSQCATTKAATQLKALMQGHHQLIVTTGLGGYTGTGALPLVIQLALAQNIKVIAAVTLPFSFETKRIPIAQRALADLKKLGIHLIVHDHARNTAMFLNKPMAAYLSWTAAQIDRQVTALIA